MTSVDTAPHAADKHALENPQLFFSPPHWLGNGRERVVRDIRDPEGPLVIERMPIPTFNITRYFGNSGASWTNFPIMAHPRYRLRPYSETVEMFGSSEVIADRLLGQPLLCYDERTKLSRYAPHEVALHRAKFALFCREHYPLLPLAIRSGNSKALTEHSFRETTWQEMAQEAGGTERFEYNYAFNGAVLMKPVMEKYLRPISVPIRDNEHPRGMRSKGAFEHISKFYQTFGHAPLWRVPLHLQILFAILDASVDDRRSVYLYLAESHHAVTVGSLYKDGYWLGSGKYAPLKATSIFDHCLAACYALGLLEILPVEREVCLTSNGREMMSRFHKANRDPDIVSRFVAKGSGNIPYTEAERIDACLLCFFKKFKALNSAA